MSRPIDSPDAEVAIDRHLVTRLLSEQMPDLAALGVSFVANGWDNAVYRLGRDLCVRLPRRAVAVPLLRNEQRWLPELEPRLTLPAPIPVRLGGPGEGYPWPWSVCRWVPGRVALETPPDDPIGAAIELGAFLAALHVPAPPEAPPNEVRGVPLPDRRDRFEHDLRRVGDLIDVPRARSEFTALAAAPRWRGAACWLHGDLHPLNLLVVDGALAGVVDFGDVTSGDPASDLAVSWLMWPHDPAARRALRGALPYGDADWERARGWAICLGLAIAANSADRPRFAACGRAALHAALNDAA